MIIIDNLLEKRQEEGKPFKVAMIGTGFIGRGVALQILNNVPGIDIVAISNRRIEGAINAYKGAGIDDVKTISTVSELEDCIKKEQYAVTDDAMNLCKAEGVEAIIELTGAVEFGAEVITTALKNKKHVIIKFLIKSAKTSSQSSELMVLCIKMISKGIRKICGLTGVALYVV